jgi:EF hand domain-containing protein
MENTEMSYNITMRGVVAASAVITALIAGTAALADPDDDSRDDDRVQIMPLGIGTYGGMNMMARPIDSNSDGIVSAAEASQHASIGFALFDRDDDGQISEDEYLDGASSAMPMGRRNVERRFVNRIARFKSMDTDTDTNVTLSEFMANVQANYEAADANGDGNVTVWEFRAQQNPF